MVIVLMGVSGSGKTTVGRLLAQQLGWPFYDGDDFHPTQNVSKMEAGIPLSDADRAPWLAALEGLIRGLRAEDQVGVVTCSALKEAYRAQLRVDSQVRFVHLEASPELLAERLRSRGGHFMPSSLLGTQFRDLEEPGPAVIAVDVDRPLAEVVAIIRGGLGV